MQKAPPLAEIYKQRRASSAPRRLQDSLLITLFLLPALILFLLFVIYPIFRSMYFSTFNWNGLGPAVKFVGLRNFQQILVDKVFIKALGNVLLIVAFSLGLQLPLALGLAVMVGRDLPGRGLFRTFFFLPYVLSEVNVAIMFLLLYNPNPERGLLNAIVALFGAKPIGWLSNPHIALFSIFMALTWKYFGFHMLLYLAGLQNIPIELEEAARIDGATSFQNFWYITLPLLGSTIRTSVYLSVLGSLQQFILVQVMTRGGPVNATETLATYMYRFGFIRFQLGYGSAVALYMFFFCLIFSLIYQYLTRKPDYLSGL
jgi:raffinose/stachyose/melibiose transport system permease protein